MPTVTEFISQIKEDYAPDYARTRLLEYANRVQKALFNHDHAHAIWMSTGDDTFPLPYLSTTSGTLQYDISTATFYDSDESAISSFTVGGYTVTPRKVRAVFIQDSIGESLDYNRAYLGHSFSWAGINENWTRRLSRIQFRKVPVAAFDKCGLDGTRIVFVEDPGTHTDKYLVEFYHNAIELTSESIPWTINADDWEGALIDGVVGYIEDIENGASERLIRFRSYWIPKYLGRMNSNITLKRPTQFKMRPAG